MTRSMGCQMSDKCYSLYTQEPMPNSSLGFIQLSWNSRLLGKLRQFSSYFSIPASLELTKIMLCQRPLKNTNFSTKHTQEQMNFFIFHLQMYQF